MKPDDAVQLYNKYIGDWGGKSTQYRFEAIKDGAVVKTIIKAPMTKVCIKVKADRTELKETCSYDVASIRIEAVDEFANRLPYYNDPIILEAKCYIELIGPSVISMSGGMCGTYVKTKARKGKGKLIIRTLEGVSEVLEFTVK